MCTRQHYHPVRCPHCGTEVVPEPTLKPCEFVSLLTSDWAKANCWDQPDSNLSRFRRRPPVTEASPEAKEKALEKALERCSGCRKIEENEEGAMSEGEGKLAHAGNGAFERTSADNGKERKKEKHKEKDKDKKKEDGKRHHSGGLKVARKVLVRAKSLGSLHGHGRGCGLKVSPVKEGVRGVGSRECLLRNNSEF